MSFLLNFLFFKSKYIIKKKEVNFNLFLFNIKCLNYYISGKKIADTHNCSGTNVYRLKQENGNLLTNSHLDRTTVSDDTKAKRECYTITLDICPRIFTNFSHYISNSEYQIAYKPRKMRVRFCWTDD